MQDSSPFRWLEERGPACQLIALLDDATSRIWTRFTEHDTTEENLRTLQGMAAALRAAEAHYTDKNSIFRTTRAAAISEQLQGEAARSQFGRALQELGIASIAAQSPQAKGRIERLFQTLQDRLVKEMRLAGIDSLAGANHFFETCFLPEWEERFMGSAQEFVETSILGCFLKNDEFGLCERHALSLEQQIGEIFVAAAPSKKGFDVGVDGFHHTEAYFGTAVVQNPVQVIDQHVGEFLKGRQPLPSQFIDPALQIAKHRSFIAVGPQPLQAFLEKVGFHHPPVGGEQIV